MSTVLAITAVVGTPHRVGALRLLRRRLRRRFSGGREQRRLLSCLIEALCGSEIVGEFMLDYGSQSIS